MQLQLIDWLIIIAYCVFSLIVGLIYTKRASSSVAEFFVGGRSMPWWLIGTSLVAAQFASDTPLVVSAYIRKNGIVDNWFWWCGASGAMLCVFFFAPLWRRASLLTDVEFLQLRYGGGAASALRGFLAVYQGIFANCIAMGWIMLGMANVGAVVAGWPKVPMLLILIALTAFYTILSGYWGVVVTDFVQFIIAMGGSIMLAVIVLWHTGGPVEMVRQINALPGADPHRLALLPDFSSGFNLSVATFLILMTLLWWGGAQGSGYMAQRLFSAKDERHATLAMLWYAIANYVLRPWPWIIVGMGSLIYFPLNSGLAPEMAYPKMIVKFLPTGLRGVMIASFLAAFMSSITTRLNWGSSYLVNDLYRPFLARGRSEKHYVGASRMATVVLVILAGITAWQMETIQAGWIYLMMLGTGGAIAGLLRWYWWRINVWSEISSMLAAFIIANGFVVVSLAHSLGMISDHAAALSDDFFSERLFAIRGLVILVVGTVTWIVVTLLTKPVDEEILVRFYQRVRPGGWWGRIAQQCPEVVQDRSGRKWLAWGFGVISIYAALLGIGEIFLGKYVLAVTGAIITVVCGYLMFRTTNQLHAEKTPLPELTDAV